MITRFAPCPSYYAHLGHLRGLILLANAAAQEPGSRIYLRYDDLGPESCRPEYYRSFLNLFRLYGIPLAGVIRVSQRRILYQNAVKRLIRRGRAYVCDCPNEVELAYRRDCACRERSRGWSALGAQCTVRFRSTRQADYVIMRHLPDRGLAPTLVLQSAVDDKALGVDYLLRGRDLESSELRLREVYDALPGGRPFPRSHYWGRIAVYHSDTQEEYPLSKRLRRPQSDCPGLAYLHRRHDCHTIRRFLESYGATKHNIRVDLKRLQRMSLRCRRRPRTGGMNMEHIS